MVGDEHQIEEVLRGTVLQRRPLALDDGAVWLVKDVNPRRLLRSWREARQVLPPTGRWPLAIAPQWHPGFSMPQEQLADLAAAAEGMDPERAFRLERLYSPPEPEEQEQWWDYLEGYFPGAGLQEAMARELPDPVSQRSIDRWLHEQLVTRRGLLTLVKPRVQSSVGTRAWYEPETVDLALLPTSSPWLAGAWVDYYGLRERDDLSAFMAALRHWNARWGAELVASWGTMLQFQVDRRPRLGEESWQLAGEVLAWAGSLQKLRWEVSLILSRSDTWFFHDRP